MKVQEVPPPPITGVPSAPVGVPTGVIVSRGATVRDLFELTESTGIPPACVGFGEIVSPRISGVKSNVTVVLAVDSAPGLGAVDVAHAHVLDRLAASIRNCGPRVEVLGLGDLTLAGRKFSGSAQRRLRDHFLVHATILYDFPIDRVAAYTLLPRRQPSYRAGRSHVDFLINLDLPRAALVEAIRTAWLDESDQLSPPYSIPEDLVQRLLLEKFADPLWIERL